MSKFHGRISRRTVLRGAGAMLALPFLEAMTPLRLLAGESSARPPLRMGIFSTAGGTVLESWKPKAEGTLGKLPSILRPLEPVKDDLLVLSGLSQSGQSENLNAHEHCALVHLTGGELRQEGAERPDGRGHLGGPGRGPGRRRADATCRRWSSASTMNQYSFRGPPSQVPYEANPRLVFERMFRGRKPVVPNWQRRAAAAPGRGPPIGQAGFRRAERRRPGAATKPTSLQKKLGPATIASSTSTSHSVRSIEKRIAFVENSSPPGGDGRAQPRPVEADPADEPAGRGAADLEDHAAGLSRSGKARRVHPADGRPDGPGLPDRHDARRHARRRQRRGAVPRRGDGRLRAALPHAGAPGQRRPVEDADPIAREACRQIHAWYTSCSPRWSQDEGRSTKAARRCWTTA